MYKKSLYFCLFLIVYHTAIYSSEKPDSSLSSKASTLKDSLSQLNGNVMLKAQVDVLALWPEKNTSDNIAKILDLIDTLLPEKRTDEFSKSEHFQSGFSLLHLAVLHQKKNLVAKLVNQNNVNATIETYIPPFRHEKLFKLTALHVAALNNDVETARILLEQKRVRHNLKDAKGETALHKVSQVLPSSTDTKELVSLLVQEGCCLHRKNNERKTPLDLAKERYAHTTVQALNDQEQCRCYHCNRKDRQISRKNVKATRNKNRDSVPAAAMITQ